MAQTIQQQRAKYALAAIRRAQSDAASSDELDEGELKAYAAALPAMIQMNGLGQACAFYRMKRGTHERLYNILRDWLCGEGRVYAGNDDLLEAITRSDMHRYRLAQAEAQALMDWVRKFAKAFIEDKTAPEEVPPEEAQG